MTAASPDHSAHLSHLANDPWFGLNPTARNYRIQDDPYPVINWIRENRPVHQTPAGQFRVFRHADVVRVLRDLKVGMRTTEGKLPGADESLGERRFMLQQDPPNHTRLRRLVSKGFTPPAINALRPHVQALVDQLIDQAIANGKMDIIADLARPLPATVICQLLGVPLKDRELFTDWTAHVTHLLQPAGLTETVRARALSAAGNLWTYFSKLIEERRNHLTDDMLSVLIRAEEEGDRLSPEELVIQAVGLLVAGFETTIGLIGNGVRALLLNPEEKQKLIENPQLITGAVEECLRYEGPIMATLRVLHEDAEVGGVLIPKNSQVIVMISSAHRDGRVFEAPDDFRIERDHSAHLAFGGGIHFCLGAHLARMEAQVAIGTLFRRLPELQLASNHRIWGESLFRILGSLPVEMGKPA